MGRLPVVAAMVLAWVMGLGCLGCDDDKGKGGAPLRRSDLVVASGPVADRVEPTPDPSVDKPRSPRTLCAGTPLNRDFSEQRVSHGEAPGAASLGTTIRIGHGRWVWLNLWAAWCGPCKEELPLLFAWQKLFRDTDFVFLSLDDDQRQFLRFLQQQPSDGLRSSYWLPEGKTRAAWLKDLGLEATPELPIQILINPQGKVHCIVQGVVENEDLPRVRQILNKR